MKERTMIMPGLLVQFPVSIEHGGMVSNEHHIKQTVGGSAGIIRTASFTERALSVSNAIMHTAMCLI